MKPLFTLITVLFSVLALAQKTKQRYLIHFTNKQELHGYKAINGKIIIPAKYYAAFTDTMYTIAFVASKFGWVAINRQDSILLEAWNVDNGPDPLSEGLFRFVENGKMGFADRNAKKIIPAKFDYVNSFEDGLASFAVGGHKENEELHRPWVGGVYGVMNKKGRIVIKPGFITKEELKKQVMIAAEKKIKKP